WSSALMRRASRTISRASATAPTTPSTQTISGGIGALPSCVMRIRRGLRSSTDAMSQPVACPQCSRFERGDHLLGKADAAKGSERARVDPRHPSPEQPALGGDERRLHVLAVALAQDTAQIADAGDEAEFLRLAAGPIFAGEQGGFGTRERGAAAAFDERDEPLVDVLLDRLEVRHVLGLFGQERVEHHLALARGVDAPLDA